MKIIFYFLLFYIFEEIFTQFINNLNYNQIENLRIYYNKNTSIDVKNTNSRNPRAVYYQTYELPSIQNHFTVLNNVLKQNTISSNKISRGMASGYEIIKLKANENPFILSHNKPNHNFATTNQGNTPPIQYSTIELRNPIARSLSRSSPTHYYHTQQHSSKHFPNSNFLNSQTPSIGVRFGADEESPSAENHNKDEYKNSGDLNRNTNFNRLATEAFQYQYNKGWSVHEAVSVNDIVIPHLEQQKNSKYSTPNAPEAHYYQKFYDIYNHVEHQTKQDLGQYEKESINDDFNGRSIVAPGQYPHMAAVGFLSNEEKIEFKCGGSLISKTFVITAAHCCYLNGETPIIVKLGIINLKSQNENSDPQRRAIKEIIVHPSYNFTLNYHDIALLKLQSPVEFTKFVRPILLWSSNDIPYERVFTMGYGSTSFAKAPTNILTELSLSLIPLQTCKEILLGDEKAPNGILESQLCGRDIEKNRDTCQGDSGGPLQLNLEHRRQHNTYRYYLVGIISYGEFCGSKKPGVYTRVSSYCKWIASLVWPNLIHN